MKDIISLSPYQAAVLTPTQHTDTTLTTNSVTLADKHSHISVNIYVYTFSVYSLLYCTGQYNILVYYIIIPQRLQRDEDYNERVV